MSFLERLETGILFRVTRACALGVILILVALLGVIVYDAAGMLGPLPSYPQPEEVLARLAPFTEGTKTANKEGARESDVSSLKMPFSVQKYFSDPESRSRLLQQIASLPPEQRDGYLRNLATVIDEAEKMGAGAAGNAAYVYMQLTAERRAANAAREEDLRNRRLEMMGAAVASLMLIALFSLVLVLLAIERNTRSSRQSAT
jgi:hypothetical protein